MFAEPNLIPDPPMRQLYIKLFYFTFLLSVCSLVSCKNPRKYTSPEGYDFSKPDKFNMPSSLLEVSGITFYKGNSDQIYSVQDEDGKVFRQNWDVKKQHNTKFAKRGDFEDLAILSEMVFVLRSDGTLYTFPFNELAQKKTEQVKEWDDLLPKGEYEGLFADAETNILYVLCKKCNVDKKKKQLTGYQFKYHPENDRLEAAGSFQLNIKQIKAINPKLKSSLSPSGLTKNKRTKDWYILSSANKVLLIADSNWRIKEAHRLNSSMFNQPEGIAFDNDFNLYISNEGDEITDGNIIKFRYMPVAKK